MAGRFWQILAKAGLAEEVVVEEPSTPEIEPPVAPSPSTPPPAPRVVGTQDTELTKKLDQGARTTLLTALEKAGAEIVEDFEDTLQPLEGVIPDEGVRYKTALSILAKKHPLDALLNEFDRCMGVLDEASRKFGEALQRHLNERVGTKVETVAQCDATIERLEREIGALSQQLLDTKTKRTTEQAGIADEQARLDLTQRRFDLIHQEIRSTITTKRALVTKYGAQ